MTLRRAALLAAAGVVLRGAYYVVANLVPSWEASEWSARLTSLLTAIIGPLAWAYFFTAVRWSRGIRGGALIAAAVSILEMGLATQLQYPTFSALSEDTAKFVLGALVPGICWLVILLRFAGFRVSVRLAAVYLILFCLARFGVVFYQFVDSFAQIGAFLSIEPGHVAWRLIATPLIWMFYWITQALFLRWAQKA